jgi:hypothetical protein
MISLAYSWHLLKLLSPSSLIFSKPALPTMSWLWSPDWIVSRDYHLWFFHESTLASPPIYILEPFKIWLWNRRDIRIWILFCTAAHSAKSDFFQS